MLYGYVHICGNQWSARDIFSAALYPFVVLFLFLVIFFLCVCMGVLPTLCLCIMCMPVPGKARKGCQILGVIDDCELPCGYWE